MIYEATSLTPHLNICFDKLSGQQMTRHFTPNIEHNNVIYKALITNLKNPEFFLL